MRKLIRIVFFIALGTICAGAQTETLTNSTIIEMTRAGLSPKIISSKILKAAAHFDVSASALIEMKNAGVADAVIDAMMARAETVLPGVTPRTARDDVDRPAYETVSPKEAVAMARTIAFKKSSAQPSRQNLEKALLRNKSFSQTGLTILRTKEDADLLVDIGFVSGSWITHRYVYRIYDRRSGAVLAAGETTSWGSLADNLARHVARSLSDLRK